jgi:hypothetical protein
VKHMTVRPLPLFSLFTDGRLFTLAAIRQTLYQVRDGDIVNPEKLAAVIKSVGWLERRILEENNNSEKQFYEAKLKELGWPDQDISESLAARYGV